MNLLYAAPIDIIPQIFYATFLGLGFAGIAIYTRNLWPAIIVHTVINGVGDINDFFAADFVSDTADVASYVVSVVIIFIVAGLPGLFFLRRTDRSERIV